MLVCEPKPLQKPYPPITVGGSSEPLMQEGRPRHTPTDSIGVYCHVEEYKRKLDLLENQCKIIGRDFGKIEKSCWPAGQIIIAQNERELSEKISLIKPATVSLEEFKKTTLAGTPDDCIEQLQVYADLGVTYFMLFFADLPKLDGLKQFSEDVINKIS